MCQHMPIGAWGGRRPRRRWERSSGGTGGVHVLQRAGTNSMMSQIDLWSETLGPFLAGLLITGLDDVFGFVAVGLLNVLSFPPQLLLLRRIYAARAAKLQPLRPEEVHRKANPLTPKTGAWSAWLHHPSGIQPLGGTGWVMG
eukprot:g2151.t1